MVIGDAPAIHPCPAEQQQVGATACALALRLPEIWQVRDPREARRTWGLDWFAAPGLDADDQDDLLLRFARMRAWFA